MKQIFWRKAIANAVVALISIAVTGKILEPDQVFAGSIPSTNQINVRLAKGIECMANIANLPFLKRDVQIRYAGSIAKSGSNGDNIWWLYQDNNGEWVLFDVDGPGCIYNFANHRGQPGYKEDVIKKDVISDYNAPETYYRFYFDGSEEPQFIIKASEFGIKKGFETPLTDQYANWVKRTWFPMFFRKGCKVTSSARLLTAPGGWGGIMYHNYATVEGVPNFSEAVNGLAKIKRVLKSDGVDPKPTNGNCKAEGAFTLKANNAVTLLDLKGDASISSCKIKIEPYVPELLKLIWVKFYFDDYKTPYVNVPIGAFFGNEAGQGTTTTILQGLEIRQEEKHLISAQGYNYFPMPYWKSARMVIEYGAGSGPVTIAYEFQIRPPHAISYPHNQCGYFRAAYRNSYKPDEDDDVEFAQLRGTGHVISGTFSANACCEADYRIYTDGCATPQVETDGSESWAGFGNGFYGRCSFPLACQDKTPDGGWCETRLLVGDCYPFYSQLNFRLENYNNPRGIPVEKGFGSNYHGAVFYYGVDAPTLLLTDIVDVGDPKSERLHKYQYDKPFGEGLFGLTSRYEGCQLRYSTGGDKQYIGGMTKDEITDWGRAFTGSSQFTAAIRKDNCGVRLRRRSDQYYGRQRAKVFVDGKLVTERTWYRADRNQYLRWLDDEFDIPPVYTRGKDTITLRLEYVPINIFAAKKDGNGERKPVPGNCLAEGRFGKGLDCSAEIRPTTTAFISGKEAITVEFWVKLTPGKGIQPLLSYAARDSGVLEKRSSHWEIMTDDGLLAVYYPVTNFWSFWNSGKSLGSKTGANIADNKWHYVAMTMDTGGMKLYVDGSAVYDTTLDCNPFHASEHGPLMFGKRETGAGDYYGCNGILDEVRISKVIRDTVKVPDMPFMPDENTIALWHFDRLDKNGCASNAVADGNPVRPFFVSPPIMIVSDIPAPAWTEYYYWIFSYVPIPNE